MGLSFFKRRYLFKSKRPKRRRRNEEGDDFEEEGEDFEEGDYFEVPERVKDLRCPNDDTKSYRKFKLDNGLEVLLIRNQDTSQSAAVLTVDVGSFADSSIEGLAHLIEHLLFCGSQKFNETYELHRYMNDMGGDVSAETKLDYTTFSFEVASNTFYEFSSVNKLTSKSFLN